MKSSIVDETTPPLSRLERWGWGFVLCLAGLIGLGLLVNAAINLRYLYAIGTCGAA